MSADAPTAKCSLCGKSFAATVRICPDDGTVLEHDTQTSQLGKVLDGKYRLDSFLSQGGMGAVYKATHVMLGKTVAVKLINPELVTSADVVRRFQREARAATALNHPNIVAVFDLGQTAEGTLYIAMEFVNGPSLKSVILNGGPIPPARTIALMRQIVSALSMAHRNKIIHRDLKPQNIMLARGDDGQETAKLVDFGIAKTFDEATQLTMAGDAIGTPHYMAPEQAAGRPVDARSDLYSAGIILYEMLTGEVPFNDASTPAILIKHLQEAPQPPSLKNPRVAIPSALEAITLKSLEKDPARRFQTADELGAVLDQQAASIPGAASSTEPQETVPLSAMSAETRPTAVPPVDQAASAPSASVQSSSRPWLGVVATAIVVVLAAAGILYLKSGTSQPVTPASQTAVAPPIDEPSASPAMASPPPPASEPPPAATTARTAPQGERSLGSPQASSTPSPVTPPSTPEPSVTSTGLGRSAQGGGRFARGGRASSADFPAAGGRFAGGRALRSSTPQAAADDSAQPVSVAFPANPSVLFRCAGPVEICAPLRTELDTALEKAALPRARATARADISVTAAVTIVQGRADRQFGTTFAVRNYSIELIGEVLKTHEAVSMPPATTVSFDQQSGSERAVEKSRLVAIDIVDKIKAFANKK